MSSLSSTFRPSHLYSQNFLRDARLVASLLDKFPMNPDDIVYEIGAGKGSITEQLALRYKHVIAIEKDSRLAAPLLQKFADRPNVTIHQGDFLHCRLPQQPYNVFANIPFNITAAIVTTLTTANNPPEVAYLVMQREAAEMFLGQPHESLRTVLLKPWFEVELVYRFRRNDFIPAPRVDVVMLRLRKRGPPLVSNVDRQCFRDFVTYAFTAWQPTLGHSLKRIFTYQQLLHIRSALDFDLDTTPTSLSFEQWLTLFEYFTTIENRRALQAIAGSERCLMQQQEGLHKLHRTRLVRKKS